MITNMKSAIFLLASFSPRSAISEDLCICARLQIQDASTTSKDAFEKIEFHTVNKDFEQTVQFCFLLLTIFHKQERTLRIKWVTWLDHPLIQLKPIMQRQSLDILHFNFINLAPEISLPEYQFLYFLNTFPTYRKCRNYI